MIDQKGIQALDKVIQTQSFATAAAQLFITQPAVSQRIKQLEQHFGQPLLIRTLPYQATPLGEQLIGLFRRIRLLEVHFTEEWQSKLVGRLAIALNRDSLETWFLKALDKLTVLQTLDIDLITDDQELTLDYFRKGLVSACLSSRSEALPGCECRLLGYMDYLLVASPSFIERYHSLGEMKEEKLKQAPLLVFDNRDRLHEHYFRHFFNKTWQAERYHMVPSVQGFKQFALLGLGFGLIPRLDIEEELKRQDLIEIYPDKPWSLPLYWHYWQLPVSQYQLFIEELADAACHYLVPQYS